MRTTNVAAVAAQMRRKAEKQRRKERKNGNLPGNQKNCRSY